MSEKILQPLSPDDHSTQLLSGGELSVENTNVVKTEMSHLNLSKLADTTLFSHDHFTQYLQFPTVLYTGSISPQSAVGTTLYSTNVSPALMKSTRLTRVANIATNFNQWTGSMRIRMIFTKAIFMQTKIICCYLPGFSESDADNLDVSDLYGAQYHAIMNPDNDNELSFEIPFISGKNYHNMRESTGLFIVKLFQPLVSSQPTGTTNSTIPFTILLSSDASSKTPLTYRYLINPSLNNSVIGGIQSADLATQLSPQVANNINSYDNYSTTTASTIPNGLRNRTIGIVPVNVNVPTGPDGVLRQVNLVDAMYGDYDDPTFRQPDIHCKNLIANSGYVSLQGQKLTFIKQLINSKALSIDIQEFAPPTGNYVTKAFNNIGAINLQNLTNYFTNSDNAQLPGNAICLQKLETTSAFQQTGPMLLAFITAELPKGMLVGDYKLPQRIYVNHTMQGDSNNRQFVMALDAEPASSADNVFRIVQQKYGGFACFTILNFKSSVSLDGEVKYTVYGGAAGSTIALPNRTTALTVLTADTPAFRIFNVDVNYNTMVNEFKLMKKQYKDEMLSKNYSHVLVYTSLTAAQAKLAIEQGNFANFELVDNNFYSAALDARFISELTPSERFNFISLFYAVKKGINVIGKVVKFVEGALTFVEQFLPSATDPEARDTSGEAVLVDMTTPDPVYFQVTDQGLARYVDSSVLTARISNSFGVCDVDDTFSAPTPIRPLN